MKQSGSLAYVLPGIAIAGLALMILVIYQVDALEERVIGQNAQLRVIGESTERLTGELSRLKAGGAASATSTADDNCKIDRVLHPEVENYLKPKEVHWPPAGVPTNGTLYRDWWYGDPKGFNWTIENAGELVELIVYYVDGFIAARNRWTDPNTWYGDLACRVEVTDDFKEYTIYLRRGVKWHEPHAVDLSDPKYAWLKGPHELTAHDFVFAFDMLLNPQVENGFAKSSLEDLESWKALDDHTLVIRWKKKTYGSVEQTLSAQALPKFLYAYDQDGKPFAKESIGVKFNQHWYNNKGYVGVGPYRMVSYEPGRKIELARVKDYREELPAIERFVYPIYTDRNQTVLKLKANELSVGVLSPGQYREEVQQWQNRSKSEWPDTPFLNGKIRCQVLSAPSFDYIGWNADKPIFADVKVRTAMTLALRRREIIEKIFVGLGEVAMGPFLPESGQLDPDVDPLEFDLERARKLLGEAGWADSNADGLLDRELEGKKVPFEFTLLISASSVEAAALANIFKDDLLKLGIRMKAESAEWSLMQKRMDEKQFDAFTGAWLLSLDADPFQIWHSSQADIPKGSNRVGFRNKEADGLMERLRETFDPDKRREMFRRLHRVIYETQAYTFMRRRKKPFCWYDYVRGVNFAKAYPIEDARPWYVEGGPK